MADTNTITTQLGVRPTRIRESKSVGVGSAEEPVEDAFWSWILDSPRSHTEADVPERLQALADAIEPFVERLRALKSTHKPGIDVLYHSTPQHPHGITGEFDWFKMSAELMRRFGDWDLSISYEVMWFDHPDWKKKNRSSLWKRIVRRFRK